MNKTIIFLAIALLTIPTYLFAAQSRNLESVLLEAASAGQVGIVKSFLDNGANVEVKNELGATPLIFASAKGQAQVVAMLLEKGANVNAKTTSGITPLMAAASGGYADVAKLLLSKAADVCAKDKEGRTALSMAKDSGDSEVYDLLKSADKCSHPQERVGARQPREGTRQQSHDYSDFSGAESQVSEATSDLGQASDEGSAAVPQGGPLGGLLNDPVIGQLLSRIPGFQQSGPGQVNVNQNVDPGTQMQVPPQGGNAQAPDPGKGGNAQVPSPAQPTTTETKNPDGSTTTVRTEPNGRTTTQTRIPNNLGNKIITVTKDPDGITVRSETTPDGLLSRVDISDPKGAGRTLDCIKEPKACQDALRAVDAQQNAAMFKAGKKPKDVAGNKQEGVANDKKQIRADVLNQIQNKPGTNPKAGAADHSKKGQTQAGNAQNQGQAKGADPNLVVTKSTTPDGTVVTKTFDRTKEETTFSHTRKDPKTGAVIKESITKDKSGALVRGTETITGPDHDPNNKGGRLITRLDLVDGALEKTSETHVSANRDSSKTTNFDPKTTGKTSEVTQRADGSTTTTNYNGACKPDSQGKQCVIVSRVDRDPKTGKQTTTKFDEDSKVIGTKVTDIPKDQQQKAAAFKAGKKPKDVAGNNQKGVTGAKDKVQADVLNQIGGKPSGVLKDAKDKLKTVGAADKLKPTGMADKSKKSGAAADLNVKSFTSGPPPDKAGAKPKFDDKFKAESKKKNVKEEFPNKGVFTHGSNVKEKTIQQGQFSEGSKHKSQNWPAEQFKGKTKSHDFNMPAGSANPLQRFR